jgi:F-type H+-transporting ATPase subunit epsilon
MSFSLEIISPQQTVFDDEIELCILPGIEGDFGILKNHMPFLTTLRIGIAYIYKNKNIIETFLVNGGIVEVSNNKCTLLSEDVVKTSDYKDQKTDDKIEIEKIRVSKKLYYY